MPQGKIIKALSGFYYVQADKDIYQCRGRGVFRKRGLTPLVGDVVDFDISGNMEGYIQSIEPRKNELIRPPVANIEQAVIVVSLKEPDFSAMLLDKFLVVMEAKSIEPLIFISKEDLANEKEIENILPIIDVYREIGYHVEIFSSMKMEELNSIEKHLEGKVSVFAGQSGVGKSSLVNALIPGLELKTMEISESLGRGKHTTRHVELIPYRNGLIADTPGFSSLDFAEIALDQLPECFPEFVRLSDKCKFRGCNHINEPKCAVKEAVENNEIYKERYQHYLQFFEDIQNRKPRY